MALSIHKDLESVLRNYDLRYTKAPLVLLENFEVPTVLAEDLRFTLSLLDYKSSESAIREYVISPILKAAWKTFAQDFIIWVEKPIYFNESLNGVPDYIISQRSAKGKIFFE
jgi:hypothetical protein